jgi:hypothetical protein
MKKYWMTLAMMIGGVACGGGEIELAPELPADGLLYATDERALNWGSSVNVAQGVTTTFNLSATAQQKYYIAVTPSSGDLDLYVKRWNGSAWVNYASSLKGTMQVDRLTLQYSSNASFAIQVYGYTAGAGTISVSWETSDNRLDLDVPYLNQNSLTNIGFAACSSASAVMVLAAHGIIPVDQMDDEAYDIFAATANTSVGLRGRNLLRDHLEQQYGIGQVEIDTSGWPQLYATIQSEIRAGRPLILGSRSMSGAGHYIVVRGFVGNDYNTARLIVNDPNGVWNGYDDWTETSSGMGLEYDYTDITSNVSDGVFVIVP